MRTYTCARTPGATYFFTVNLAERHGIRNQEDEDERYDQMQLEMG